MTTIQQFNDMYLFLRRSVVPWRAESLRNGNNRCCISGNVNNLSVHHLNRSFKAIIHETFQLAGLSETDSTTNYTLQELNRLSTICLCLHRQYGYGVILSQRLHRALHETYGLSVTVEVFKRFKAQHKKTKKKAA